MIAPQDLIDTMLMSHSADAAWRSLKASGYQVSIHRLHSRLSQLIESGKRKPIEQAARLNFGGTNCEVARGSSLEGSENLLKAQIRAGQVFPDAMARWEARHGRVDLAA